MKKLWRKNRENKRSTQIKDEKIARKEEKKERKMEGRKWNKNERYKQCGRRWQGNCNKNMKYKIKRKRKKLERKEKMKEKKDKNDSEREDEKM